MNDKVKELVEYMATSLLNTVRMESKCVHKSPMSVYRHRAKQILSHPDLALILKPQYIDWETEPEKVRLSTLALVIPLAEALKETE